jgi:adenosylcobyric acid synthase
LPYRAEIQVDQEDSLGLAETATRADRVRDTTSDLDVAVIRLPHISNFTDVEPLARFPGVSVRYVDRPADLGDASLVILPGTKATARDLEWLRDTGLADAIVRRARDPGGPVILGLCGGFQLLGKSIEDPFGCESPRPVTQGLSLLDVFTLFRAEKSRHRVNGRSLLDGSEVEGYEIHMGETTLGRGAVPWFELIRERTSETVEEGAIDPSRRVFGTYVHGLFNGFEFLYKFVDFLRVRHGLAPLGPAESLARTGRRGDRYAPLAAFLREHLDLAPVWDALELFHEPVAT